MSRGVRALDRLATLVVGLALVAGGLALLDWRYGWVGRWPERLSTSGFMDVESTWWWPWAYAGGGIVVGLLGAMWLLGHAPRRAGRTVRLDDGSDADGTVRVDLASVADAMAADLQDRSALADVRGSVRRHARASVIELRGRVDDDVSTTDVGPAVEELRADLEAAFPDGTTTLQVLLDRPRRRFGRRGATPRVH